MNEQVPVVVISGSGGAGVGSALARRAKLDGMAVVGCDLSEGCGDEDEFVAADLTDEHDAKTVVEVAVERFGRVDLVIANACRARPDDRDPHDTSSVIVAKAFEDNFLSTYNLVRAALPVMLSQQSGLLLFVSSVNAQRGDFGQIGYSTAKAGLEVLTRAVTASYAKSGVRSIVAILGTCPNDGPGWVRRRAEMPELEAAMAAATPRRYLLDPDEAARNILALADPTLSAVTGCAIPIDGGLLATGLPLGGGDWRKTLIRIAEHGFREDAQAMQSMDRC